MSLNKVMPQSVRIQVAPGRDLAQGHQVRGIDQAGARECAFCGLISVALHLCVMLMVAVTMFGGRSMPTMPASWAHHVVMV